jgi:chloramphenicol 3-O phosphotransferase
VVSAPSARKTVCALVAPANGTSGRSTRALDAVEPTVIVLHGPTSAGKSTIAKALQATAPAPAFHVSLDAFVTMSNRRDMRSDEEQQQAYHVHCENLRSTLARVLGAQFDIILDLVLRDEAELEATLRVLSGRPTRFVSVSAPIDVLEERERVREDRAAGMAREQVGHPAYARPYDLTIDTSTCTPAEAAETIRAFIRERQRLTGQCSGQPSAAADFQR